MLAWSASRAAKLRSSCRQRASKEANFDASAFPFPAAAPATVVGEDRLLCGEAGEDAAEGAGEAPLEEAPCGDAERCGRLSEGAPSLEPDE